MLVGREGELALLVDLIGERRPVAVFGEAGVGKTSLVRAAAERSAQRLLEAGGLATLSWMPYLPLQRAFGRAFEGDESAVAAEVEAAVGTSVLFVDDLQWADRQTAAVVPLLAGRVPLVAAVRRGDPRTPPVLDEAAAAGLELMPLEPLEASAATELARTLHPELSESATKKLVERSGGNPFLLEQLASTGEPSGSLRLAVAARLRGLSPSGRDAIAALALLGRPAAEDLLGAGAAEIVDAGLATANGAIAIRHALLAEATVESLGDDERRGLHSILARLLEDPGEAARHHAAAGERRLAHEKATAAAGRASTRGERIGHLAVAAANADGPEAQGLRITAARELIAISEPDEALALVSTLRPADPGPAAEAALLRSQAYDQLARPDDARRELDAALALQAEDVGLRLRLAAQQSRVAFREGDYQAALVAAETGATFADAAPERVEAVEVYAYLGSARRFTGTEGARPAQERALAVARRTGPAEVEFSAMERLAFGLLLDGDPASADALMVAGIERARELNLLAWERSFRAGHAGYTWHLGEPAKAAAEAEAVLAEAIPPGDREFLRFYWWQAMSDLGRGEEVRAEVERCVAGAPQDHDGAGDALWALADIHLAAGRPQEAERAASSYLARFTRASSFVRIVQAWAQFELSQRPVVVGGRHFALVEAVPVEIAALAALTDGDNEAASEGFDRAAALWDGRHVRGGCRCRWAAAESLRRSGQEGEAKELLLALEVELERRQLQVLLRRVHRSLRLLGVRRAARRSRAGALTGREAEVLELVAAGLTNDEIARRLGLGRPTVVRLIGSAQRKLGVRSRLQAAALAAPSAERPGRSAS